MVQEDKDNFVVPIYNLNPTSENTMNAKAVAATNKSTRKVAVRPATRISDTEYSLIAAELRKKKLDVSPTNVCIVAGPILDRKFAPSEVNATRVAKLNQIIRDLDAADEARVKERLSGKIESLGKGNTGDLLIKSIVTSALETQKVQMLEGMRKLLLAQESRYQQRMNRTEKVLAELCKEWGIIVPDLEQVDNLPMVEASGAVVRLPRVLVYGMQPNQKQPMYDLIRQWGLQEVADVDMGYSREPVSSMKRGYDVVIYNRHWVGIDDVRALKNHGAKIVEASGALSDVGRHLQAELLGFAVEAKKKEG